MQGELLERSEIEKRYLPISSAGPNGTHFDFNLKQSGWFRFYLQNGERLLFGPVTGQAFDGALNPGTTAKVNLGAAANRWLSIFTVNAVNVSSDARLKHDISSIRKLPVTYETGRNVIEELFFKLIPKTYGLNNEDTKENNKIHFGFIAQDLRDTLKELGFNENEIALLCHDYYTDENGELKETFGIGYAEVIPILTHMLQKAFTIIDQQNEDIISLKNDVQELKKYIQ